ncbi:MAG: ankyrin repeat domain-containing protein [Planctomycetota bacterium]
MKVRIVGPAAVVFNRPNVTERQVEAIIAAATSEDSCVNHLGEPFIEYGLGGGHLRLRRSDSGSFEVFTEYESDAAIPKALIQKLAERTVGQWSDGIGSGCFRSIEEEHSVRIELCPGPEVVDPVVEVIDEPTSRVRGTVRKGLLSAAASRGQLDEVVRLVEAGAEIEELSEGITPLCNAVLSGHADVALRLLKLGAKPDFVDEMGEDALYMTAVSNEMSDDDAAGVARELIDRGVEVIAKRGDYTVLEMASIRGKAQLEQALRDAGATE